MSTQSSAQNIVKFKKKSSLLSVPSSMKSLRAQRDKHGMPHPRKRSIGLGMIDSYSRENVYDAFQDSFRSEGIKLQYYVNDETISEKIHNFFLRNATTSAITRICILTIKLLIVVVYLVRTATDQATDINCCERIFKDPVNNDTRINGTCKAYLNLSFHAGHNHEELINKTFNFSYNPIFYVCRYFALWLLETIFSVIAFGYVIFINILSAKTNPILTFLTPWFLLDVLCTVPLILSIFFPIIRMVWIPSFLQIWLARNLLNEVVNYVQRNSKNTHSILFYKLLQLLMTFVALVISCIGLINHFERAGSNMDLFNTFWFVVVTFSTVGYGDIYPAIWPSKLCVMFIIFLALGIIPVQIEQIAVIYMEQQKLTEYSDISENHVVLCATELRYDAVLDFLNEFYEFDEHQDNYNVVILCPNEAEPALKRFLQAPLWQSRVTIIQGSTYREEDLQRAKISDAEAVFVQTDRGCRKGQISRLTNDEHTVLRSMAIKDFAPRTQLFVQCLRSETPFYLQFADETLCDEELKHALLALNCDLPGMSTFITLVIHTAKGIDDDVQTDWKKLINRSAGMEIYDVKAKNSKFFRQSVDQSFPQVACKIHRQTGAILFAVERDGRMQLNPGKNFKIDGDDILFYICLTHEDDAAFTDDSLLDQGKDMQILQNGESKDTEVSPGISRMSTIGTTVDSGNLPSRPFEGMLSEWTIRIDNQKNSLLNQCRHGFPPQSPYLGFSTPTLCYINKLETREAILEKDEMKLEDSEDCDGKHVWEYSWPASHIIVCADEAELSLYNFIIPLRAYYRSIDELRPIVLLVEKQPSKAFLDCISWFPMVYYLCGTCTSLDDLLRSGILWAHSVIILDRGHATMSEEEHMADSKQLIATETICRLFPAVNVSLELTHARNMRFMNFSLNHKRKIDANPVEEHADAASDGTAELSYLFRGPFASGKAFCSSMLDSLLYQSFVKPYLPKLLRLLLGLQFEPGSGFMGTVQVSEREAKLSYSQMFKILTEFTGEIPLGVYRTDKIETVSKPNNSTHVDVNDAADEKKNKFDFRRYSSKKQGGEYHRGSEKWKKQVGRAKSERDEMNDLIEQRAKSLHIPSEKIHEATYRQGRQQSMTEGTSYVIINPEPNLLLKEGDIIYTIKSINQRREDEALKNEGIS